MSGFFLSASQPDRFPPRNLHCVHPKFPDGHQTTEYNRKPAAQERQFIPSKIEKTHYAPPPAQKLLRRANSSRVRVSPRRLGSIRFAVNRVSTSSADHPEAKRLLRSVFRRWVEAPRTSLRSISSFSIGKRNSGSGSN